LSARAPLSPLTLSAAGSAATADFLPGRGCTCVSAVLESAGGPVAVVWSPEGFSEEGARPTSGGIPILAPYPGRLPATTLWFEGSAYELEPRDAFGRPMHGFACDRPWRIVDRASDRFTAEFLLSRDASDRLGRWPADFRLTATWQLARSSLSCTLALEPLGRMPAAFGLHPYCPLPILPGSDPEACSLELPAALWQPQREMLPSGSLAPAAHRIGFPGRVPLDGVALDDVFTGLAFAPSPTGPLATARLVDPSGAAIAVDWTEAFTACVLFTPPHRRAVCIEPYTCLPGGAVPSGRSMPAGGESSAGRDGVPGERPGTANPLDVSRGWRVLDPGETLAGRMTIRLDGC
jgi:aldose 1-epimerase